VRGIEGVKIVRGAIVGVVSGVIYGPLNWLVINLGINFINGNLYWWVTSLIARGGYILDCVVQNLISGLVLGLFLGLGFAFLYKKLPGNTSIIKGIVISIVYWLIIPLGLPILAYLIRGGFDYFYWGFIYGGMWKATVIGLGPSLLWGWLLGYFWESDKLRKLSALTLSWKKSE